MLQLKIAQNFFTKSAIFKFASNGHQKFVLVSIEIFFAKIFQKWPIWSHSKWYRILSPPSARAPFFGSSKKAKKHSKKHFSARHAFLSRDIVKSKSVSFHERERERERERPKFECQFWSKKSFQFEKGNEKHENRFIFKLSFGFGFLNPISELDLALNRCLICI